ncbi:MAG: sorbitol dehydrogenase, partial [Bacteroidales bacterium]|nr:sorbitol dehydrogenase [Bacteroidales bacterium]
TTSLFVKKELDIMGSRNANPSDFEAVIKYLTNANAPIEKFISRIIEPNQADEALKTWSDAPGKVFRILVEWE